MLSSVVSQNYFRLVEIDNRGKASDAERLQKKFDEQLYSSELHEGIYDLLHDLRDRPLLRNLPSENRLRGIEASRIHDQDVQDEVDYHLSTKVANKVHKKNVSIVQTTMANGQAFTVNIDVSSSSSSAGGGNGAQNPLKRPRDTSVPEFLKDSRVKRAEDVLQESFAMAGDDEANGGAKAGGAAEAHADEDGDDDDVAWED